MTMVNNANQPLNIEAVSVSPKSQLIKKPEEDNGCSLKHEHKRYSRHGGPAPTRTAEAKQATKRPKWGKFFCSTKQIINTAYSWRSKKGKAENNVKK